MHAVNLLFVVATCVAVQLPLAPPQSYFDDIRVGQYTKTPQNSTCPSYHESQWTGTVDVSPDRRLFYWFFESRNDPAHDPVIVWLDGGAGCSSMMGVFTEMGPCWLAADADSPVPNPWSWNNNASLLFIDQPAGVGFSTAQGALPYSDLDGAQDFQTFLNIFFGDMFRDKSHLPIHIAGESYGGHYVSTYAHHILESRRYGSATAFHGNITSLIMADALIEFAATALGVYELLCYKDTGILNATECAAIAKEMPELQRIARNCDAAYTGADCLAMERVADRKIHNYYFEKVEKGERSPYHLDRKCTDFPGCPEDTKGNFTRYLNQPHVKAALGMDKAFEYNWINWDVNTAYANTGSPYKPVTRELGATLDAGVRVLVLQGNKDYVINTPGQVWAYDNLRWEGQAEYRLRPWREFPGGRSKGTRDGRLVFAAIDEAGHMVAGDAREETMRIVNAWMRNDYRG